MSYLKSYDRTGSGFDMSDLEDGVLSGETDSDDPGVLISQKSYDFNTTLMTIRYGDGSDRIYCDIYYNTDSADYTTIESFIYYDKNGKYLLQWKDCDIVVDNDDLTDGADWTVNALNGADEIIGNKYADTLKGADGSDILRGNGGNDILNGEKGDDKVYGQTGDDRLYGKSGADRLSGNQGDDSLSGSTGKDSLTGGTGTDLLSGGTNRDTFIFETAADSAYGRARDTITDYQPGYDVIDLGAIDADTTRRGNQQFDFIGRDGYGDTPGELRFKQGVLSGDVDGDGHSDFQIELTDASGLHSSDFIL